MLPEVTELPVHSVLRTVRNLQSKLTDSHKIVRCYSECLII